MRFLKSPSAPYIFSLDNLIAFKLTLKQDSHPGLPNASQPQHC